MRRGYATVVDADVRVTFTEVEPGRIEVALVNTWTGPAAEPSEYGRLDLLQRVVPVLR